MHDYLNKQFPRILPYLLIIFTASAIRYLYYIHAPGIIISEDTYSYYLSGQRMLTEKLYVGSFRPPIYSLFLAFLVQGFSGIEIPILSPVFFQRIGYAILIQFTVGIIGLLILFRTVILLKIPKIPALLAVLLIGFNLIIFSWDRLLLTESFAVFSLILCTFLMAKILQKPRFSFFLALLLLWLFCVFLRPFYLFFPIFFIIVILIRFRNIRIYSYVLVVTVLYIMTILYYSRANYKRWSVPGVSTVEDINLLGKILDFDLNIESASGTGFYYQAVREYRSLGKEKNPYRFMEYYGLIPEEKLPLLVKVRDFDYRVVLSNLPEFIFKSLIITPSALMEVSEKTVLMPYGSGFLAGFFQVLFRINRACQVSFFLTVILIPVQLVLFIRKPDFTEAFLSFVSLAFLYQIATAVLLGYSEYGRLIVPAQPLMYLFCFWWVGKIIKRVTRIKL